MEEYTKEQIFEIKKVVAQDQKEMLRTLHNQLFVYNASVITILLFILNKSLEKNFSVFSFCLLLPIFICGLSAILILSSYNIIKEAYNTNDLDTAKRLNSKSQSLDYYGWQCFIAGTIFTFAFLVVSIILYYMQKILN